MSPWSARVRPRPTGSPTRTRSASRWREAGVTVVSGLAIGIDAAAHEGALEGGGGVIGVVATGLDVVYPRRHAALFDRVRESGLLVSELGYGVQPRPGAFPVRNRIIAALADVVVVVEATLKRRRPHHRRPRVRVRPAGARDAGLAAQPGGRGHQRAHRRRRPSAARTVRRAV